MPVSAPTDVAHADRALYRAKKDGRDRIVLAPPSAPGATAVWPIGADSA